MGLDEGILDTVLVTVALAGLLFGCALVEARMAGRRDRPVQEP
ncbi:hypothetical protein [Terrabacter sp. NPDC080008]